MPCGNGQTVSKRKHGVCSSLFGLSTSLLLSLCFALTSGMVDSVNHHCPKNCTCSVVGPQRVVNCSNTGLDRVPEATDIPYNTSILDLSKNQISSVDASVFDHLTSLKELYLQGNRLSILPHGILGCRTLSIIDLSNNQISTLEERICDNLFNLSEINLSFNPFVCDCKLFRLVSWIAEKGVVVHQPESMQCAKPPEVKNLPLLNVSLSSVICGLNYAACLFDTNTERKELVIFSSSTSGNFTRDSCNAHCFKTGQLYGGLGSKNECLCSTNSEPNFISESQCSAACADNQVMKNCGWTLAKEVFLVDFAASFRQLQAFSVHKEATLSVSISVSVSTLSWDFGDLTPLLNTTTTWASHKYALPGRYRVKVTLWSGNKDKTIHTDIDVIIPARLEVKCPTVVTTNDSIDVWVWNLGGTDLAVDWRITGNGNETLRAAPYCPPEGLVCSENGHCYHVLRGESPWLEARQQCLSHRSGDLAVVNTPHIRNFLTSHIRNDRGVWVGLSDAGSPGTLQWVSGSALEASDDCKREKEAQVSGNTCVSLNSTGQCNTHLCSSKRGFICEFRPHATIPDADVFLEGCAVFSRHWPFGTAATVTVLTNPAREVELLMFPSVWFRNEGRLSALEFVIQELKDLVQVRFQVYRPQCTRRDLHLLLPAVCYEEEVNITVGSCPAQQQWCHFLSRCLPLSSPCHPSLCSNCSSARSLSSAFTHPNYSLVEEVLFTLPPGKSRHYLVKEGIENIHVSPGDFIAIQHDAGPGFLISCDRNPSSPWRQSYFTVNHSDWITPSLDNTEPGAWTEDAVCYLRVLYTRKQVVPIESELLKAGLPNQGMYTFQVAVARWQGSNQTFPFQETCPTELASAVEACRSNADNSTLFAYLDLDLRAPQESQVVITVENPLSSANLTVRVRVEEPLRGLKIVPNPNQRVLMESLVSYTATVEEGSDVIFKWTVDDKPSFTYYNTVLNVIYQNAAVYKLSVMASNRVSSVTQHYNVTVDRMLKMAGLTVTGIPAIVTQGSAETLSASINVDISVDATVRWCFGDGGYQEYSFKPPYDNSLILPETNAKQVVLQQNVTYTYPQPGEYTLTVSVSNRYENVSQKVHVFVYSILTSVEIQNDTDPLVVGMPAVFEAHPLPSPYGIVYTWNFGDGSPCLQGRERRVNHTFSQSGVYTLSVLANNTISSIGSQMSILVFEEIRGLTASSSGPTELNTPTYINAFVESGNNITWIFDMGDGSVLTSAEPEVEHKYVKDATYVVNITAMNHVNSLSVSLRVQVFVLEVLKLEPSGCIQELLNISFIAFVSGNSSSYVYEWSFGDGSPNRTIHHSPEVAHRFSRSGNYHLSLVLSSSVNKANFFTCICVQPVVTNVTLLPQSSYTRLGEESEFIVAAFPEFQYTYFWDFGTNDSSVRGTNKMGFTYKSPGRYFVTVTVLNNISFSNNTALVEVQESIGLVVIQHNGTKSNNLALHEVYMFTAFCDYCKAHYTWDFGDGSILMGRNAAHAYNSSGHFNITLTGTNEVNASNFVSFVVAQINVTIQELECEEPEVQLVHSSQVVIKRSQRNYMEATVDLKGCTSVIPGKLVPIIDGGTFRIWSKSQDLLLNGEKSYDPNLDAENQSPLSYSWDCFLSSKNSPIGCSLHFGSKEPLLVIPEDMLEADMEYTFRLTVSKPGMSPESTNQTVLVKNGRIPMVLLECVSCKAQSVYEVSQSSYVYLAGTCSNCQDNSHTGHWTALNSNNESLVLNMSTTTTGSRGMNLVVRQGILRDGDAYIFTLHVTDPMMDGVGVASIKLRPNLPPAGGSCTLHPHATASALTTKIQFTCTGYEDSDDAETPLVYSLIVTRCVQSYCEEFYVYKGTSSEYSAFVPPGFRSNNFKVDVSVRVEDHQEASTVALNQSMVIRLPEPPQGFQSLTQWLYNQTETALKDLLKQGDPQQVREFSLALITVLNEYEQTGPPSLDLWREREQRVIIRSNITRALVSLDVNTVNDIKQTSAALAQCTTVSKEFICQECQKITLTKLESMLDILQSDTRQGTVTPTEIADNILNIMGDLIHLVNQAPPQPAAEDKFSISNDQLLVASKAYNLSSELMRILMHSRVLNEEPLVFNGSEITTAGKRADPLNLLCYVDDPTCRFSIPESFNTTFKDVPHIVQVLFQVESNPFPFGYVDNYTVSTEVASMEFQTENGTQIPISSLSANKAITVKVSNGNGVKKVLSGAANVSEWSSVIVMVRTGNTNRAAGLHVQLTFTVLNDAGAVKGTEPYITAYLDSHRSPNEHNCTAQKKITLSLIKGLDHKPYTFFLSPEAYDTTQDYYVNVTNGCRSSPVRLEVGVYSSLCQYFNAGELLWKTDGMVPLEDTTMGRAVCRTEHLTAFGASLFVPPESVVFIVPEPSPEMSYIVLLTCAVSFVTFSIVALIVRKLDLIDIKRTGVIPFCGKDGLYKYEIQVKTGWGRGSGTTAHVGISLYGREGRSGHRHLDSGSAFTRSSLDIFHISTDSNLGSIWKIRIWHDNKGLSPSWYLQYVVVKDLQTSNKYFFLIEDWLSVDNDKTEGMVDIEVEASTDTELQRFSRIFVAELERGLSEKHIWLSLWERPARSRFTRLQRATCCFLLVHLFLLANSVWYGLVGDKSRRYTPVSTLTSVSGETLAVGLVTCLIVYPIYLFVLALFRMARSKVCVEQPVPQLDQESLEIDDYLDSSIAGSSFLIFNGIPGETYSEDTNLDVPIASSKSLQKTNFQESVANWPDLLKDPSIMVGHLPKLKRGQGSRHLGVDMTLASEEEEYNNRNKYFTASDEDLIKKILADGQLQMSKLREAQQYFSQTESEMADLSSIFGDKTEVILLQKLNEPVPAGTIRREPPKSAFTSRTVVTELSKRMLFPYWCSPAAHVLSLLLCVVSSGVSVWIGLRFSSSVALMWIISGIFSFLASFFVLEPLKILAEAFYFSLVVKRVQPEEQDTLVACPRVLHVSERIQKVRPPQGFALFQAREEAKKVRILHRMLTNFLVYMLFLLVVLLINYGDSARDASSRQLQALLQQRLHSTTFSSIRKHEDVWLWLSGSLIPYLYNNDTLLKETSSILLGSPRLRQIRAREGCTLEDYFNTGFLLGECKQFASTVDNGTHSIELDRSSFNLTQRWVSSPPDFTGVWYWGKLSIYNSGGYIQELKRSADVSKVILQHLQNFNWLDKMSKALFVEFTLYNTNTDVFAVVTFLVEFSLSAGTLASMDIKAMSLRRLSSGLDLLLLMMVFLLAFAIYFLAHEGMAVRREGCRYFTQPWNIAQWCTIALSLCTVVVHLSRVSLADRQWDAFLQHREGFTDFYQFAFQSAVFTELAAVLLFLLILKVSHQLRFLREWSIFGKTLRRAAKDLLAVTVALVLLLLAYSQLGYLVFSSSAEGYSSVGSAFLSLLGVPQGLLARRLSLPRPSALSLAYLISYGVIQGWLVLRLFPAALLRSYALVRSELYRPAFEPQDYEMVELFLRRLKVWMGLSKTKEFRHKVRFEGMDPLPSRCSSDSKSLCPLPTPDTASDTSSRPSSSSPCGPAEALGPGPPRERAEAEATLRRLPPVFDALLLQLDRVNKVTEDLYQTECRLERAQRRLNRSKCLQVTEALLSKYCLANRSASAGRGQAGSGGQKPPERRARSPVARPGPHNRESACDADAAIPSSLFRHPAHTTTIPTKKRKPPPMKNKVHPNTDVHVTGHPKMEALSRQGSQL
ncbi:PKD1 protein, partial [Atractosteus spatula]|nr:PKD1 protein [Atractosteus spatula]